MLLLAPAFLVLLVLAPLPWLWPRGAGRRHALLRSALFATLAIALAEPAAIRDREGVHVVAILDASPSAAPAERERGQRAIQGLVEGLTRRDSFTLVADASTLAGIDAPAGLATFSVATPHSPSNLGAALDRAASCVPAGEEGVVVLVSDGHATDRDIDRAVQHLSSRGIRVLALPLATEPDVRVTSLEAEDLLRRGHPGRLVARLEGGPARVDVSLHAVGDDEALVSVEDVAFDERTVVTLGFEPAEAGFVSLELRLEVHEGADAHAVTNRLARPFAIQDPLPLLYLGERVEGGRRVLADAVGPGWQLDAPGELVAGSVDVDRYPLIMLDDRRAESVPEPVQGAIVEAVSQRGAGLVMSGGGASFGPGGWFDSPIADTLPVEMVQKEEKRDPSTTLVVIIDTSGSMGGNRVQLAKEVARLAMQRLLPHDKCGIVEFYGAKRWAAPIQPASNTIELQRALNRLDAGGGTVILPAIEEAFYALQNIQTRYKHVLVLTDGGVETGPFESLIRRMADKGITLSSVLIGPEAHSEFLVSIANWGKGRFYSVPNRFNLPEVLLKTPASAKLPAYRPGAHALEGRGSSAWWAGADPQGLPPLSGYVETRARPGAEVLLETRDGAHPVLASWRYGLGRVTALTTEPTGPGTESWQDWPGYGELLSQVFARTAADDVVPFRFRLERRGGEARLRAERRWGTGRPHARELGDDRELGFAEIAPGIFETRFLADAAAELRVDAGSERPALPRTRLVAAAHDEHDPELQVPFDRVLPLAALAAATGGQVLDASASLVPSAWSVPDAPAAAQRQLVEYAPWLLVLALLLFGADLAWRRRARGGSA